MLTKLGRNDVLPYTRRPVQYTSRSAPSVLGYYYTNPRHNHKFLISDIKLPKAYLPNPGFVVADPKASINMLSISEDRFELSQPSKFKAWLKVPLRVRVICALILIILAFLIINNLAQSKITSAPAIVFHRTLSKVSNVLPMPSTLPKTPNVVPPLTQGVIGLPMRLIIPSINVNAALDYVSLTSGGALGTPNGPTDAAWYKLGPLPGAAGIAIIAGHSGYKDNIPAVFDNLHKLRPGDIVDVEDQGGATTSFIVREIQIFGKNDNASNIFNATDSNAHLNLITCQGVWSQTLKSYSNRLVVFTDKIQNSL